MQDASNCIHTISADLVRNEAIEDLVGFVNETQLTCEVTPSAKIVSWGCKKVSKLALQVLAEGLRFIHACAVGKEGLDAAGRHDFCEESLTTSYTMIQRLMFQFSHAQRSTPLKDLGEEVQKIEMELTDGMLKSRGFQPMWGVVVDTTQKLAQAVRWYVWRTNHFLWLIETLHVGKVVNGEWGKIHQEDGGAHDSDTAHPLTEEGPDYVLGGPEAHGMRWEIVSMLIRRVIEKRGENTPVAVVEIGVFAGHFSQMILTEFPTVQLIGIDPYIGKDGTFPGNFSKTLDPDVAYSNAQDIYDRYGEDRSRLLAVTSEEAAEHIPDEMVDLVFVDGCHLYHCVDTDLRLYVPKVKPGGIVCGHDFGPQWGGVVRAVHEHRKGQRVNIGMDWMYWWTVGEDEEA